MGTKKGDDDWTKELQKEQRMIERERERESSWAKVYIYIIVCWSSEEGFNRI